MSTARCPHCGNPLTLTIRVDVQDAVTTAPQVRTLLLDLKRRYGLGGRG